MLNTEIGSRPQEASDIFDASMRGEAVCVCLFHSRTHCSKVPWALIWFIFVYVGHMPVSSADLVCAYVCVITCATCPSGCSYSCSQCFTVWQIYIVTLLSAFLINCSHVLTGNPLTLRGLNKKVWPYCESVTPCLQHVCSSCNQATVIFILPMNQMTMCNMKRVTCCEKKRINTHTLQLIF